MTEDETKVIEKLKDYFSKRYEWEDSAYKELQRLKELGENHFKVFKDFKPKLDEIYSNFLTTKERKYTLAYNKIGSEPYYDPKFEEIETTETKTKSKIIVRTKMNRNNSSQNNEYVFLKKDGLWKLDNKKTYWDFKEKWESTLL